MVRVIVEVKGGAVVAITADEPAEVLVIDADTQEENLWEIEPDKQGVKTTEEA